jgi:putative intracellular protease/amidase
MAAHRPSSVKNSDYVFILWGDKFEEAEAAIFATELRRTGLCVKLIGLAGQRSTGMHGLVLLSDMTLGEALPLAHKAICVVIPCNAATAKRIENDPRILDFFQQAKRNGAQFIMKQVDKAAEPFAAKRLIATDNITTYSEDDDLTGFARHIAGLLFDASKT